MSLVWQIISGLGSLVGLATGMFVIWDRFFRDTPRAYVVPAPLMPGSQHTISKLRLINSNERPVLISWENSQSDYSFRLAVDNSIRAVVVAALPGETTLFVDGNHTVEILLLKPAKYDKIDKNSFIQIDLRWQFGQPSIWKHDRHLRVSLPKSSFMAIIGEGEDDEKGIAK